MLHEFKPDEWNNIAIVLQDLATHLITFNRHSQIAGTIMNKKIDDIVNILYSSTTFTDQSNEDVRDQVSRKFGLLNQKLLTDLSTLKTECT